MATNIIKRILSMIPILIAVSIILFFLLIILPGDAAAGIVTADQSAEYMEQVRESMGLNRPAYIRYLEWLGNILRGDFGKSLITRQPIIDKIVLRLPVTFELTLLAMIVSIIIALPAGIISAIKRNSILDIFASVVSMIGVAMPPFWLGMLLILVITMKLGWIPSSGYVPFSEDPLKNLLLMIMPAFSIGASLAATVMRQTRSALLEVLGQEYIITAKAKGLAGSVVIWKHALRNALIPVVTTVAMQVGRLFGGAVVSETVFVLPGIGREIVDSIMSRDYPVVMSLIMVVAVIVVVINTLLDIAYVLIDPRISHSRKR